MSTPDSDYDEKIKEQKAKCDKALKKYQESVEEFTGSSSPETTKRFSTLKSDDLAQDLDDAAAKITQPLKDKPNGTQDAPAEVTEDV